MPMVPSPLSWAKASWTSSRLLEYLLPEKQENWPRGPAPGPAHTATSQRSRNRTRLPNAPFPALHPLSCTGPMGPGLESSATPILNHPSTQQGKPGVGPRERQRQKPGKKPEARADRLPERLTGWSPGMMLGGVGVWEGIFPSPSPEPAPHGTGSPGTDNC